MGSSWADWRGIEDELVTTSIESTAVTSVVARNNFDERWQAAARQANERGIAPTEENITVIFAGQSAVAQSVEATSLA